jgi:hypothetical protein
MAARSRAGTATSSQSGRSEAAEPPEGRLDADGPTRQRPRPELQDVGAIGDRAYKNGACVASASRRDRGGTAGQAGGRSSRRRRPMRRVHDDRTGARRSRGRSVGAARRARARVPAASTDRGSAQGFGFKRRIDRRSVKRVSVLHTSGRDETRPIQKPAHNDRFPVRSDLTNRNAPPDAQPSGGCFIRAGRAKVIRAHFLN